VRAVDQQPSLRLPQRQKEPILFPVSHDALGQLLAATPKWGAAALTISCGLHLRLIVQPRATRANERRITMVDEHRGQTHRDEKNVAGQ